MSENSEQKSNSSIKLHLKRAWVQNSIIVLVGLVGVYSLVYWDVVSRARHAYEEGEKYMAWHQDPSLKKEFLDKEFADKEAQLKKQLSSNKISEKEYQRRLDGIQFDREFAMNESSLKYAYQWYKDTYELFSLPESKWVREARKKAPEALALWKQELMDQKIPFDDTMFQ